MKKTNISIIISVFNEEENIKPLVKKILSISRSIQNTNISLFFVDDGSTDKTLANIKDASQKYVSFTRNYGHEVAMMAGIQLAEESDAYIFMDGDFQHPPEVIPQLIKSWESGNLVVLTKRIKHSEKKVYKIFSSLFYFILNHLSDFDIKNDSPDFRLIDKRYAKELRKFTEMSPVVRFMLNSFMKKEDAGEVSFVVKDRKFGESKYNYWKLFGLAIDSIVSFSTRPLRIALISSFIMLALSILAGAVFFIEWLLFGNPTPGFMTLLLTNISLGSANLFILSVIGEYIAKIHIEVKKRPMYTISEMKS